MKWERASDPAGDTMHMWPTGGRRHLMLNCWCNPTTNEHGNLVTHNEEPGDA